MPEPIASLLAGIPDWLVFAAGMVLLLAGGNWLVDGAATVARRLGAPNLVIGLTLVAFGTSAPELVFNLFAAFGGHVELSFGNVVGSNIANIGLVLGIGGLVAPLVVHRRVARIELGGVVGVTLALVLLAALGSRSEAAGPWPGVSRIDAVILLVIFAGFLVMWMRIDEPEHAEEAEAHEHRWSLPAATGIALLGIFALAVGGRLAELGAVGVAESWGWSQAFTGLTIVAVATSMPELVTVVIAGRKGYSDLAVGNVVGSNVFNIVFVLATTSLVRPVPVPAGGVIDLLVSLGLTVLLIPFALTNGRVITRWQSALLLVLYAGWLGWRATTIGG